MLLCIIEGDHGTPSIIDSLYFFYTLTPFHLYHSVMIKFIPDSQDLQVTVIVHMKHESEVAWRKSQITGYVTFVQQLVQANKWNLKLYNICPLWGKSYDGFPNKWQVIWHVSMSWCQHKLIRMYMLVTVPTLTLIWHVHVGSMFDSLALGRWSCNRISNFPGSISWVLPITWGNVDPVLCHHMESLGHNEFV